MDVYALTSRYLLGTSFALSKVAAAQPVDQGNAAGSGFATAVAVDHGGLVFVFGSFNTPAGTEYLKMGDTLGTAGSYAGSTFRDDPAITSPASGSNHNYLLAGYDPKTRLLVALNTNQPMSHPPASPGSIDFEPPTIDAMHAWRPASGSLAGSAWPTVAYDAGDPTTFRQGGFVGLRNGGSVSNGHMLTVVGAPFDPWVKYLLSTDILTGVITTLKVFDDINYAGYYVKVSEDDAGNIYVLKLSFLAPSTPMVLEVYDPSMALLRTVTLDSAGLIPRLGGTFPNANNSCKVRPDGKQVYFATGFPLVDPLTLWALDTTTGAVVSSLVVPDKYVDADHSAGFVVMDWGFVGRAVPNLTVAPRAKRLSFEP
jgi:hypothetical protein